MPWEIVLLLVWFFKAMANSQFKVSCASLKLDCAANVD